MAECVERALPSVPWQRSRQRRRRRLLRAQHALWSLAAFAAAPPTPPAGLLAVCASSACGTMSALSDVAPACDAHRLRRQQCYARRPPVTVCGVAASGATGSRCRSCGITATDGRADAAHRSAVETATEDGTAWRAGSALKSAPEVHRPRQLWRQFSGRRDACDTGRSRDNGAESGAGSTSRMRANSRSSAMRTGVGASDENGATRDATEWLSRTAQPSPAEMSRGGGTFDGTNDTDAVDALYDAVMQCSRLGDFGQDADDADGPRRRAHAFASAEQHVLALYTGAYHTMPRVVAALTQRFRATLWVRARLTTSRKRDDVRRAAERAGIADPRRIDAMRRELVHVSSLRLVAALESLLQWQCGMRDGSVVGGDAHAAAVERLCAIMAGVADGSVARSRRDPGGVGASSASDASTTEARQQHRDASDGGGNDADAADSAAARASTLGGNDTTGQPERAPRVGLSSGATGMLQKYLESVPDEERNACRQAMEEFFAGLGAGTIDDDGIDIGEIDEIDEIDIDSA